MVRAFLLAWAICFSASGFSKDVESALTVTVPEVFYAVEGVPTSLNCRNLVDVFPSDPLDVDVKCAVGQLDGEVWHLTAGKADVGDHRMSVRVARDDFESAKECSLILRVVPADSGETGKLSLLVVGDSLTNASRYPNTIARLLEEPGNPEWRMMGTHHPKSADLKVFHEGYGGWTWARFNTRYEPEENQTGKTRTSPFVFLSEEGEPGLNVPRYFSEFHDGELPDIVFILLGINDCFHPDPEDPAAIEARIDTMMEQAEIFLASLKEAAPQAMIGIGLTPAANDREGAFVANYGKKYTRDGWRRIQRRLVQRQIEAFSGRKGENLYVVPTSHSVDPHLGYPDDNAVHPNDSGYESIGRNVYGWVKAMLAKR
ncbi:SGNH/GDSL hydrolase family protein [Verrucomicrobiales bacterium]|jgi:lysophospholipase L1-like esterase|nr:SGNH/GDSL hydrolase family protein [Verrucomicrobiales bacterium]